MNWEEINADIINGVFLRKSRMLFSQTSDKLLLNISRCDKSLFFALILKIAEPQFYHNVQISKSSYKRLKEWPLQKTTFHDTSNTSYFWQ